MDRNNVRMIQGGSRTGFLKEAGSTLGVGKFVWWERLDGERSGSGACRGLCKPRPCRLRRVSLRSGNARSASRSRRSPPLCRLSGLIESNSAPAAKQSRDPAYATTPARPTPGWSGIRTRPPGDAQATGFQSQKPPFSRHLPDDRAGLASRHKSCCNTRLEINVSKRLIRAEF